MPFIQCELQQGLTDQQKDELAERIVNAVHQSIGSSIPHINVVIRDWPGKNLVEAGSHNRKYEAGGTDEDRR